MGIDPERGQAIGGWDVAKLGGVEAVGRGLDGLGSGLAGPTLSQIGRPRWDSASISVYGVWPTYQRLR